MPDSKTIELTEPLPEDAAYVDQQPEQALFGRLCKKILRPSLVQAGAVIMDKGFCSIANFLTGVLVARACPKAEYGLYVLCFSLMIVAQQVQRNMTANPLTVYNPRLGDSGRAA